MDALSLAILGAALTTTGHSNVLDLAGLRPGSYPVGLRSFRLVDTTRPWPSADDPSGGRGRPIPIALWYPARPTPAPPATVGDLIVADARPTGEAWSPRIHDEALGQARPLFDSPADRPLDPASWQRVIDTPTGARLDAPPLPGRRALVVLEGGLAARSFLLAPIAELLATHGYVVAALATEGSGETERLGFDLAGIRTQAGDMQVALEWLGARPEVDPSRVGLVAWSAGGVSQALLRLERPDAFRAAASLDSGSGYAYGADLLTRSGGVDPTRLRAPFLQVDVAVDADAVPRDDGFLRAHPPGLARGVLIEDLGHADFTLPHLMGRTVGGGEPAPGGMRRLGDELLGFLGDHLPTGYSTERVELASDEWRLVGDLDVPDRSEPVPAVLLLNQAAGSREAYRGLAEELARRGVASLRVDLRAHGDSTNLGRFVPPEGLDLLEGTDRDVSVALERLRLDPRIRGSSLAVVGASYSGEMMMEAGRHHGFVVAYVGLSPGSLSDDSIAAIDRERLPWLLVVARDERYLKEVEAALRRDSRTAVLWELPGVLHATDLLEGHAGLAGLIALWLDERLAAVPPD